MLTTNKIELARHIVETAFKNKFDLSGEPYMYHINRVCSSVVDNTEDSSIKQVALLHDLLEDCPEWSGYILSYFFSEEVVKAVVALSKLKNETYNNYLSRVLDNPIACLVKKADLEDNMDITRLSQVEVDDLHRLKKYHSAYQLIIEKLNSK